MIKKLLKYLSSLRFTILLICLLGLMFIIGLWVPQARLLKSIYLEWQRNSPVLVAYLDAFGLTSIYTSPITVTLWVFFFLNLALVMWQRIPVIKNRITLSEAKIADPLTVKGYSFQHSYQLSPDMDGNMVIALLRKHRFAILGDGTCFYGVKNRFAPIAFILFHLSFFLILLGGLITVYTRFMGYVDLAQGEPFKGDFSQYNSTPPIQMPQFGSLPSNRFTITSIVPSVAGFTPTGISIKLVDSQGLPHEAGINTPYSAENASFVFNHLGVAPLVILKSPSGQEIAGSYVKLDVLKGKADTFTLGGFNFKTKFYPDYVLEKGKPATRSMEFNNQVFTIVAEQGGKKIAEGTVSKGGTIEFAGYRLEVRDILYWVRFYVVKQYGVSVMYLGYAIASIALIWRLIFYRKELVGAVRDVDGVRYLHIAARSEFYKDLAEDDFTKFLESLLGNGRTNT
ncbi:MAG: cytochrome c biogenesis protein ResB [Oryzomonas sp.]|uniref:cytochrome c biogenesis protein ResB n=1 Tax=Oryzomonas sp. TaxID=2855186 RepID=UPI00284C5F60|nr:cytochrome c biogenesis protein ResB [Oryzomonas sp.]MDR3579949.1 cytochrome c biogenesis protein ResB [Oryzomonas sp.]